MQIYEVKNDTAGILYSTNENKLFLADFLFIEDNEQTTIAQITDIATTDKENVNVATVKFYLSVDRNNKLMPYDGHTPARSSKIGTLDPQEIIGLFRPKTNELVWGNDLRKRGIKISTDLKFLSSNLCIICDKADSSKNLIKNMLISLNSNNVNSIVLDFEGKFKQIKNFKKTVFGKDFRIPLNNMALEYIFNYELEDLPVESKATVQSIIIEVEKYIETLPDGYIPFDIFSNIIFDEFQNSRDSGLLIFANKLTQYKQKNIFANEAEEFNKINSLKGSSIIDISDIETKFHKLIFDSTVSLISGKFYLFADISEDNANKEIIKRIYEKNNIRLIPVCRHDEKYLPLIKQYSNNFVVFAPAVKSKCEEHYEYFLNKLTQNDFILYGEGTLSIPLLISMNKLNADLSESSTSFDKIDIVTNQDLDDLDLLNKQDVSAADLQTEKQVLNKIYSFNEIKSKSVETNNKNTVILNNEKPEISHRLNNNASEYIDIIYPDNVKEDENSLISRKSTNLGNRTKIKEINEQSNKDFTEPEVAQKNITEENLQEFAKKVQPIQFVKSVENIQPIAQGIETNQNIETIQPIAQVVETNQNIETIQPIAQVVETNQNIETVQPIAQVVETNQNIETVQPIAQGIETNQNIETIQPIAQVVETNQNIETIQPIEHQPEMQTEHSFVQEVQPTFSFEKRDKHKANELPVYEPKETPQNNIQNFEVGNRVKHAKYGLGHVENIMNYGDKKLCCIQFDNVGRKLLDPSLTTIEKLF